jgi:hypothetical protein
MPREATALSLGAHAVARAISEEADRRGQPVQIVRTGSRGLFWLEPLLEVHTSAGRIAYGPVQAADVPDLFAAGFLYGGRHRLHRLQRRRGRQRHLRRPHAHGRRSLRADRGHDHRRLATGRRRKGYIYSARNIRTPSPRCENAAIAAARARGRLSGRRHVWAAASASISSALGAGAYVCGEETSLLESLEGKRGQVRQAAAAGAARACSASPTVINNVITARQRADHPGRGARGLSAISAWAARAARCRSSSPATSSTRRPGRARLRHHPARAARRLSAAARLSGRPIRAVQVGGPLGAYLPRAVRHAARLRGFAAIDGMIGHGGIVVFDDTVDMAAQARFAMEFCAIESCGKCTPCRIGSTRGVEVIDRSGRGRTDRRQIAAARSVRDHDLRLALRAGRPHALSGAERAEPFPGRFFARARARASRGREDDSHAIHCRTRLRHPRAPARTGDADHRRPRVTVPEGTSVMRAAALAGIKIPKLCATDSWRPSAPAACAWSRSRGMKGTPASCTTPVAEGMKVTPRPSSSPSCAAA